MLCNTDQYKVSYGSQNFSVSLGTPQGSKLGSILIKEKSSENICSRRIEIIVLFLQNNYNRNEMWLANEAIHRYP